MAQAGHGDGRRKKSKIGEDGRYHTAQVGPGDRGRKKSKKGNGFLFGFDYLELASPVMGTFFSSIKANCTHFVVGF